MTSPVFTSLMNNLAVVLRKRRTSDLQGGWIIGYVGSSVVRGRIRPASSSEREAAQREERDITHVLYVEFGADIVRGDRVIVRDLMVDVDAIREPSKDAHHLEIDCLERQFEGSLDLGS